MHHELTLVFLCNYTCVLERHFKYSKLAYTGQRRRHFKQMERGLSCYKRRSNDRYNVSAWGGRNDYVVVFFTLSSGQVYEMAFGPRRHPQLRS
ncbi:hypothetical protein M378DRAFT_805461 [Amanita muscaria Koide BX008]|uniref:Uncharacterized protein n=1 Tax=Amanita muscaria (strain Koide BX008) TaxID=946122 RepID=A0A0C2WZ33_AMAMK|nr:hypothetical protein M378DRAFT_805461 [Amanita muscaria Koide BX008]